MEMISSRPNSAVKDAVRLKDRAERESSGRFFCEGVHLAEEFLRFGKPVERVFATPDAYEKNGALLDSFSDRLTLVTPEVYSKLSDERAPQGIFIVAPYLDNVSDSSVKIKKRNVILDSVRDPGNVGTVLRTAAAFGIDRVILGGCADVYSSKTVRASMGALFCVDIVVTDDLAREVSAITDAGCGVYAAMLSGDAQILSCGSLPDDFSVVIGNEGSGVSDRIAALCTGYIRIPQSTCAESLNAAVAASVFMWEMRKR